MTILETIARYEGYILKKEPTTWHDGPLAFTKVTLTLTLNEFDASKLEYSTDITRGYNVTVVG